MLTTVSIKSMYAQYYSVNIDTKTVAAMVGAYATETAAEALYNEQVKTILKHYSAAEVAAAGIFASKYLDRKALTDLGIWANSTENYYYRRIYNLVSTKIMPKIWTVAKMMLKNPHNALYWGTYLMKVCDDTKTLCMQFESIVTNSTLSFSDIAFLQINQEVAEILKLSELGGVDFKSLLDNFSQIGSNFTKENLKTDISNLYQMGINLASAGFNNLSNQVLQSSNFNDLFQGKIGSAITIVDNYTELFHNFDQGVGPALLSLIGGEQGIANLFELSNYNLTSWIDDYARESMGQYYTQRWYIYRQDAGSEILCSYIPPTDKDAILEGSHWYRINTTDNSFYPSSSQREAILKNSENHAGYSRTKVNQLNASNDGNTYTFSSYMSAYLITTSGGKLKKKAYAYEITVTKSWNNTEVVYEDYFDSYTMDLNTFKAQLNARLSELNDNEEGYTYYIGSDAKRYYQMTDAQKIKGTETATISVTCNDGATFAEGSTQYKCDDCGKSLSSHTKSCSMKTSVTSQTVDTSELEAMLSDLESKINALQSQIEALEDRNTQLLKDISKASIEDAVLLRQQYNENKDIISSLQAELNGYEAQKKEMETAIEDAEDGENIQTDDYYRIPAIMQELKSSFDLTWEDAGSWSGYTFIRHASLPNIRGIITFEATISIARKPKYFLGIKIHRAIVQISWKLSAEYSDTQVVDVITLDPSMSDQEKADIVNKRVSEIARQYPSCNITTEYAKAEPLQDDNTDDKYHLLWSSDRLEIAREIDTRLTKIYSDLVSLEKMMHYKLSIIDVLKSVAPYINDNEGRKLSIIEECHERWMRNASGRDYPDERTN